MNNRMTKKEAKADFKKFVLDDPHFSPITSQDDLEVAWNVFAHELHEQGDIDRLQLYEWTRVQGSGIKLETATPA